MVLFGQQNILTDPPITQVDIIVCRNFTMYLDADTRAKVLSLFEYALRSEGLLFLGSAEMPDDTRAFSRVHPLHHLYRRSTVPKARKHDAWPIVSEADVRVTPAATKQLVQPARASSAPPASSTRTEASATTAQRVDGDRSLLRTARQIANDHLMEDSAGHVIVRNEQLRFVVEELISTNEQLETSREEVAALNEELRLGNAALSHKIRSLTHAQDDLSNLARAEGLAAVFVSDDLRVLRFTDPARAFLPLRPEDLGRPLSDLSHRMHYDRFIDDAREVIETLRMKTVTTTIDETSVLVRMNPYLTSENRVTGLVIAFMNIDALLCSLQGLGIEVSSVPSLAAAQRRGRQ
jgi:hypothetical protein